jgi:hypothetical protein
MAGYAVNACRMGGGRRGDDEEEEDATKDMPDPPAEPGLTEVKFGKQLIYPL